MIRLNNRVLSSKFSKLLDYIIPGRTTTTSNENDKHGSLGSHIRKKYTSMTAGFKWSRNFSRQTAVYTIGTNNQGQLGLNDTCSESELTFNEFMVPHSIKSINSGLMHSSALTDTHDILTWGSNVHHQIGHKQSISTSILPTMFECLPYSVKTANFSPKSHVIDHSVGGWSSFAMVVENPESPLSVKSPSVYSWGNNMYGKLGLGSVFNTQTPTKILSLKGQSIKKVVTGLHHTHFLTESGKVLSCGKADDGQIAISNPPNDGIVKSPVFSDLLSGINIKSISAGSFHSVALSDDGKIYQWGVGKLCRSEKDDFLLTPFYQINEFSKGKKGQEAIESKFSIKEIKINNNNEDDVNQIIAGDGISMALTNNGNLWKWSSIDESPSIVNIDDIININNNNNNNNIQQQKQLDRKIIKVSLSETHAGVILEINNENNEKEYQVLIWKLRDFQMDKKVLGSLFFTPTESSNLFNFPSDHIITDLSIGTHFALIIAEKKKK
eukprot:gene8614-10604_t